MTSTAPLPRVSVMMLAYNHAAFIAQAIESVLAQRTTFPIELVLGEDCSTDATRGIVEHYAAQHPDLIKPLLHSRNIGMGANAAAVRAACRGEFIALLEGDDFWTHPGKLQAQVDWLERHPEAALCFHDVDVLDEQNGGASRRFCVPRPPAFLSAADLIVRNPIATCSVVYRAAAMPALPPSIQALPMQDWPMWILAAQHGRVGYLDEVWGCYRLHANGQWSTSTGERQLRRTLQFYDALAPLVSAGDRAVAAECRKRTMGNLIELLVSSGRWREARPIVWRYLRAQPGRFRAPRARGGLYCRILLGLPTRWMREPASAA